MTLACALTVLCGGVARADSGVSDERVSLPDGPGSVGGTGEQAHVAGNTGAMTYSVPIEVPPGHETTTPQLAFSYSSSGGNGELGIGWTLAVPHIERFTLRGMPQYTSSDVFAVDGADELVNVGTHPVSGAPLYRKRHEDSFSRYSWHPDAGGKAGYWVAETRDGSRGFFGADAQGHAVPEARLEDAEGRVFRYQLVEWQDLAGHRLVYDYDTHAAGEIPLLKSVRYVFEDETSERPGTHARFQIALHYEKRSDPIHDARPGFLTTLDERLREVQVYHGETRLRAYRLGYELAAANVSRLKAITQYGLNGERFPVAFSFDYSSSLDLNCTTCSRPFVYSLGTLEADTQGGVDLRNGRATLIDINGDALPDLLDTGENGQHRFFLNHMGRDGSQQFQAPQVSWATQGSSSFLLRTPGVQAVDINGDGFTDLIDSVHNRALCNLGEGDWSHSDACASDVRLGELVGDSPGDADPRHARFLDYDGDRRIDMLHTVSSTEAFVLHNREGGFEAKPVQAVGMVFDERALQLADMNGDGLLDPVEVNRDGHVYYRLNLGGGRWTPLPFFRRALSGASPAELDDAELQDLNGDGRDDVVLVHGNRIKFALNRAGEFGAFQHLTPSQVDGVLPTRKPNTTVLFADMNASGSTDVVWIDADGSVQALELFALRPNLLTRIDNGIGGIQLTEYTTSARAQAEDAADGLPWRHRLPLAMNLVKALENFTTLHPDIRERTERVYHHGYYDGGERRYRGFEEVEALYPGDATQQRGRLVSNYAVGKRDPHMAGKPLGQQSFTGEAGTEAAVRQVVHHYEMCPLDDVPKTGLRLSVRHMCVTSTETLLQERRPAAEWTLLREERQYDGHGNVMRHVEHGVIGTGQDGAIACPPCSAPEGTVSGACGTACTGDERVVRTEYVQPGPDTGGAWVLGVPQRTLESHSLNGPFAETLFYYDGAPFEGMDRGSLRQGLLRRVCERATTEASANCQGEGWVVSQRNDHDSHGNVVKALDPLGSPQDFSGHRRHIRYDANGLSATGVDLFLSNTEGEYQLRREVKHDPVFHQPALMTDWQLVDAPVSSLSRNTRIEYDNFGRRSAVLLPGDRSETPSQQFEYLLQAPVSQVIVRRRSLAGGPTDLEQRHCVDGFGRTVQTRSRLSPGVYQVTDFNELNAQGAVVRAYQPYQGNQACDARPPEHVAVTHHFYDGVGRRVRTTFPDAELHAVPSVSRVEYRPLLTLEFDPEDNDPDSPAYNTPNLLRTDGLGRTISQQRPLAANAASPASVRVLYDALGQLSGYVDSHGGLRRQIYDLRGRLLRVEDPNAGTSHFVHDAAGNLVEHTDASGTTVAMTYEGANRQLSRFDVADPLGTRIETRHDYALDCEACSQGEGQVVMRTYPLGPDRGRGQDEYGRDARGNRVLLSRTLLGHRLQTLRRYDNAHRLVATTYPDGTVLTQRYDAGSRLTAIDGVLDAIHYDDARGVLQGADYANGVRWQLRLDPMQRLAEARTLSPGGHVLQGFRYARDRAGHLLSIDDLAEPGQDSLSRGVRYELDAWYRPARSRFTTGETLDIGLNSLDHVTHQTSTLGAASPVHVGSYRYDSPHPQAVTQTDAAHYVYDEAGRALHMAGAELSWDHDGRLTELFQGTTRTEYVYGPDHERVMERGPQAWVYHAGPNFEVRDGISTTYARLGDRRVARLSQSHLAAQLLPDVSPAGGDGRIDSADAFQASQQAMDAAPLLRSCARRLLLDTGPERVFLHSDHLHSLTLATGPAGERLGERSYYDSGQVRAEKGYVDSRGFSGQTWDATTGLLHYRFRTLDARTGRWTRPDPLFAVSRPELMQRWGEATTAYAYVGNRRADRLDPTGLVAAPAGLASALLRGLDQSGEAVAAMLVLASDIPEGAARSVAVLTGEGGRAIQASTEAILASSGGSVQGHLSAALVGVGVAMLTVSAASLAAALGAGVGGLHSPETATTTSRLLAEGLKHSVKADRFLERRNLYHGARTGWKAKIHFDAVKKTFQRPRERFSSRLVRRLKESSLHRHVSPTKPWGVTPKR